MSAAWCLEIEMIFAQETMTGEIIVDNFAGGGGASTGIEIATGRAVAIAINHDPAAILMHKTNHPYTEHFQASVWDIDPVAVCRGRRVGLAWFSPDCKHFSKAKGAALVDRKIRGLAWITLRWAAKVRPRVIILENVEEFQTWGPVRKGKPVKKLAGTTFRKFIRQLEELGYTVEYRELIAADYGAPTSRKRFYMIARCDGKPIVWPKPTHSKTGADGLPKWRSAAEIIDWSLPCPSVFATKAEIMDRYGLKAVRPLAKNTMRRIIRGVDKFTIRSGKPFIVQQKFQNAAQNIEKPLTTVTAVGAHELCKPLLAPVTVTNTSNSVGGTVGAPVHTVTTAGNQMLVTPFLAECNHSGGGHIAPVTDAHKTITAKHTGGIVAPALIQYHTEHPWFANKKLAEEFHVYGFDWTPEGVTVYVDGIQVMTHKATITYPLVQIISFYDNRKAKNGWTGTYDPSVPYPKSFDIDYIRMYKKIPEGCQAVPENELRITSIEPARLQVSEGKATLRDIDGHVTRELLYTPSFVNVHYNDGTVTQQFVEWEPLDDKALRLVQDAGTVIVNGKITGLPDGLLKGQEATLIITTTKND